MRKHSSRFCDSRSIIPNYEYITQAEHRDEAIAQLKTCARIAVDTEGDSLFSYQERVSLIQISGNNHHYVFDPLLLDSVQPLGDLFADRNILKIFHGSDYDLVSLKRDFQFKIGPIFDTALAARAVGIKGFSLQNLIETYFNIRISKKYQKANWKLRPLTKEQLDYASLDTVYLDKLCEILLEAVEKKGRLDQVKEDCLLMEQITWSGKSFQPNDYIRVKGARALSKATQKVFRELITTRDEISCERNHPPFKVVSGRHLILIAEKLPENTTELIALFPNQHKTIVRYADRWITALQKGLNSDIPLPDKVKSDSPSLTSGQEKLLKQLKGWRNQQSETEELEPAMVFTANTLKDIAREKPSDLETLAAIPSVRKWQHQRYGQQILDQISKNTVAPAA